MGHRTGLFDWHEAAGGKIVDFGGWDMPVVYSSITEEHQATRQAAGLFDVSHMGRFRFIGPQAAALLDRLLTNNVADLADGQVRYALVLRDDAGILDDVLVTRMGDEFLLVVNASNREKLLDWFGRRQLDFDASMTDETAQTGMIALQGPLAEELLQPMVDIPLADLAYYTARFDMVNGGKALVSRTGYTGEDGFELTGPTDLIVGAWQTLLERGREAGVRPCGLGARDTLRLEAGMPLYGHELSEEIDPIQAGLKWAVKEQKDFIGRDALRQRTIDRAVRVGMQLEGKRIAREEFLVLAAGEPVGRVTSGTFSPTLSQPIAMGYVNPSCRSEGTLLAIDIRGTQVPARVVKLPFYKRTKR